MSLSPTSSPASPDAAQLADGTFECPRCHRHCQSRTWFLKHLQSCRSSSHGSAGHITATPASGVAASGAPPHLAEQVPSSYTYHPRFPSHEIADEASRGPISEPLGLASSPSSSTHSGNDPNGHARWQHRRQHHRHGERASHADPTAESGVAPHSAHTLGAAIALNGKRASVGDALAQGSSPLAATYGPGDDRSAAWQSNGHAGRSTSQGRHHGTGTRHGSRSQGSASFVNTPRGLRSDTGFADSGTTGLTSQRAMAVPAAISAAVNGSGDRGSSYASGSGLPQLRGILVDGPLASSVPPPPPPRQGSFRLHSDPTWTQYTPSSSSASSDARGEEEGDDAYQREDSFLERSSRRSSQSFGRGDRHGAPSRDYASRVYGRDGISAAAALHRVTSRLQSPEASVREGYVSAGSVRNSSLPVSPSQRREPERVVPRLFTGQVGDNNLFDRSTGPTSGMGGSMSGGEGLPTSGRRARSSYASVSQASPRSMLSVGTPMFAQAMASPTLPHMSMSSRSMSPGSAGRLSIGGGGGGRTPRQFERGGSLTPRAISFQRGRAVGSGGFGTVYQAILADGSLAAVKELKLETTNLKAIDREVRAMSSIPPHPNCVRYLGSRYSAHHYYIIMEYISGGSINSLRKSVGRFRESVFQQYAYMVLQGLAHLHANGIVHRDIKGANVLLDESGTARIVDFGCSYELNEATTTQPGGGTPLWMAPEVCRGDPATEKSDVWAFGCLCLEMTNDTGMPWNFPPTITLQGVVYALACAKSSPPIPTNLSEEAQDFLRQCLKVDPGERATVADLLRHPFFELDLMEDSSSDEMISSFPPSLMKRMLTDNARRGSHSEYMDSLRDGESGGQRNDGDRRGSGLVCVAEPNSPKSLSRSSYPPNASAGGAGDNAEGGLVPPSMYSKSPSGPQLDHYPRSVNIGFSLQAVEDEDDAEDEVGAARGPGAAVGYATAPTSHSASPLQRPLRHRVEEKHSVLDSSPESAPIAAGAPPAIDSTHIPSNRRRTPSANRSAYVDAAVDEEDEDTQMITDIITQAREAYTDEDRRMMERRRRHNPVSTSNSSNGSSSSSSDEESNSFSDGTPSTSAEDMDGGSTGVAGQAEEELHSASARGSASGKDSFDDEEESDSRDGGPTKHALGATWRAVRRSATSLTNRSLSNTHPTNQVNLNGSLHVCSEEGPVAMAASPLRAETTGRGVSDVPSVSHRRVISPLVRTTSAVTGASPSTTPGYTAAQGNAQLRPPSSSAPHGSSLHIPLSGGPAGSEGSWRSPRLQPASNSSITTQPSALGANRRSLGDWLLARPGLQSSPTHPAEPGGPARPPATRDFVFPLVLSSNPSSAPAPSGSSPRLTPPSTGLAVGGPSWRSPTMRHAAGTSPTTGTSPTVLVTATTTTSDDARHLTDPSSEEVQWYTGASGRLERSRTWHTGAAAEQPKELSMAQKEMEEMLEWGSSNRVGGSCSIPHRTAHAASASFGTTDTQRRNSKDSSVENVTNDGPQTTTTTATAASGHRQSPTYRHTHSEQATQLHHHHHHRHQLSSELDTERRLSGSTSSLGTPEGGLTATETVEAKRRHLNLGFFRSRRSR